ncbi:capsular polysaccharide biosynthesis protein [Bordetella pertussis]|nr:capsular polysaccharide biosynthesis protein [Bordetella pertussis]
MTAPDVAEALARIHDMCAADPGIARKAADWASARFSLNQMIASTVRCYQMP